MPLRTLDDPLGQAPFTKTFATYATAEKKAREIADLCRGMVNVVIVPVLQTPRKEILVAPRYTAVFYCFEDMNDVQHVARFGFHCFA